MTPSNLYALILHIAGLAAIVVLVALGKVSWAEGGPIIGGLVGFAIGVPVSPTVPVVPVAPVVAPSLARPAMPTSAD